MLHILLPLTPRVDVQVIPHAPTIDIRGTRAVPDGCAGFGPGRDHLPGGRYRLPHARGPGLPAARDGRYRGGAAVQGGWPAGDGAQEPFHHDGRPRRAGHGPGGRAGDLRRGGAEPLGRGHQPRDGAADGGLRGRPRQGGLAADFRRRAQRVPRRLGRQHGPAHAGRPGRARAGGRRAGRAAARGVLADRRARPRAGHGPRVCRTRCWP